MDVSYKDALAGLIRLWGNPEGGYFAGDGGVGIWDSATVGDVIFEIYVYNGWTTYRLGVKPASGRYKALGWER